MVIGGYGNFGSIVSRHLIGMPGIDLVISGRDRVKLLCKVQALDTQTGRTCQYWCGDAMGSEFRAALGSMAIDLVIHTGGPFQGQSYAVAQSCIDAGVLGRVMSLYYSFGLLPSAIGLLGTGFLAEHVGLTTTFVIAGTVICCIGLVAFCIPSVMRLDRQSS